jgi:hypothetical protein
MFLLHILNLELVKMKNILSWNIVITVANMGVFVQCGRGICPEISTIK